MIKIDNIGRITLKDVELFKKNFSGQGSDKYFTVILDDADASELEQRNYRVGHWTDRDGNELNLFNVKVSYRYFSPVIKMCNSKCMIDITEDTVDDLDNTYLKRSVDFRIRSSRPTRSRDGSMKITPYLDSLYVDIVEDDLASEREARYNDRVDDDDIPF